MAKSQKDGAKRKQAGTKKDDPVMKVIRERRSVRNFDSKRPVEDEKLIAILEAARLAPSSNNTQPWRFIIVKDEERKNRLANAALVGTASNKWMRHAPVIIACCGRPDFLYHKSAGQVFDKDFFKIDIAIAVEHMVLEATELGLGTCWIGWFNQRKIKSILKIPAAYKVLALLPVGYPKNNKWPPAKERKKIDEFVSYEKF